MRRLLTAVVVLVFLGAAATWAWRELSGRAQRLLPDECVAEVSKDGETLDASLDLEQAQHAALIAAIAVRRELPARAATIAIATAIQESKLYNLQYGDRDSLGLFQQRPSQGWGTAAQILDPTYAIGAFYDALVRIDGYETMRITEAAQLVQRSAFPEAYADHEPEGRALASALTGESAAAFSCRMGSIPGGRSASVARDEITGVFGDLVGTPVVAGRAVTVQVPGKRLGWALAQYLVAQADRLGIRRVAFGGQAWSGKERWDDAETPARTVRIDLATTG
ncbi:hypothetical protein [Nocardioides sp.]|uniref:hypothetical protein n=1 Tax=Nocardioides sp. TaxID=35761 RepID=UPI0039E32148